MTSHLTRRRFLEAAGAATVAAAAPSAVWCATEHKRQRGLNVLLLMTDEQHYRSLSSTGNPYVETPHRDRIGREGARFDNATCVTSRKAPTAGRAKNRHHPLVGSPGATTAHGFVNRGPVQPLFPPRCLAFFFPLPFGPAAGPS